VENFENRAGRSKVKDKKCGQGLGMDRCTYVHGANPHFHSTMGVCPFESGICFGGGRV